MGQTGIAAPPVNFLRESSRTDDEFGAHSRLAAAIASTLLLDDPLRVIGLVGAWGSGKSRVVRLVEAKLEGHPVRFFTFDAWLHQSDAPRRAFLERMLQWVSAEKDLGQTDKLEASLAKLLGKSEKIESTVTPRVPILVGFALSILLLIPFAAQFLRLDWMGEAGLPKFNFWGVQITYVFAAACGLMAAPFVILTTVNLFRFARAGIVRAWRWVFGIPASERATDPGSSLVALFANKVSEQRTDIKTKDPDPTAIEFQRFMAEVLLHIGEHTNDRLVFVVDNLDRLQAEEVPVLWSTIRGLFHGDLATNGSKATPPTVLLPIDEAALLRLHKQNHTVADGFTDKTFDVAFRVPPPVHSQWQTYLGKRIDQVFGSAVQLRWKDAAARILEEASAEDRTPRSINAFVNEIATHWLQWRDDGVSFAAMAYYVAHRRALENKPWEILRNPVPWMDDFDADWTAGVAALRYGAPPLEAGQILIEDSIRLAIIGNHTERFEVLSRRIGFRPVVRRLADTFRAGMTGLPLSHAILLLAKVDDPSDANLLAAWQSLIFGFVRHNWLPRSAEDVEAFQILLEKAPAEARVGIVSAAAYSVSQIAATDLKACAPAIIGALELVAEAAKVLKLPVTPSAFQPAPEAFLDVLAAARPDSIALPWLREASDSAALLRALLDRLVQDPQSEATAHLISVFDAWRPDGEWEDFLAVMRRPRTRIAVDAADLKELQALGAVWANAPNARPAIAAFVRSDDFRSEVQNAVTNPNQETPLWLALTLAANGPTWHTPDRLSNLLNVQPDLGDSLDEALAFCAPDLKAPDLVAMINDHRAWRPLGAALLGARLARCPDELHPEFAASNLEALETLAGRGVPLWGELARRRTFWSAVRRLAPPEQAAQAARTALALELPDKVVPTVAHTLAQALARSPLEDWRTGVLNNGLLMADLERLEALGVELTIAGTLPRALKGMANDVARSADPSLARRWWFALQWAPRRMRRALIDILAEKTLRADAADPHLVIDATAGGLLHAGWLRERPDVLVKRLVIPLLKRREWLDWIVEHRAALVEAVHRAPDKSRAALAEAIAPVLAEGLGHGQREALQALAKAASGTHPSEDSEPA